MTPVYLNQPAHSLPLADHQQEGDKNHLFISSPTNQDPTSSVSCPTSCIFDDSQARDIGKQRHDQEADMYDYWSTGCGPKYDEKGKEGINRRSSSSHEDSSAKWMCSEMWLMQKNKPSSSTESNHKASSSYNPTWQNQRRGSNYRYNNGNNISRICSDCSTTSTPLWRSGPNGPKSLCNACGIRQRKARKAMEEAGWCEKTRIGQNKEKKSQVIKNKWKGGQSESRGKTKVGFQEFEFNFRRNSVFQEPVFPRDEVLEGAMLLMDLSCGFSPF